MNSVRFYSIKINLFYLLLMSLLLFICPIKAVNSEEIRDIAVSDAVLDVLYQDQVIAAQWIDVDTQEGIVTLSGKVSSLLMKERATRIAETISGVRSVINTIMVVPPLLSSDRAIESDVKAALLSDPATDLYEVNVHVKDTVVTLSGTVDSWQEKELCGTVAKGVAGVTRINNDLSYKINVERSDAEIAHEIKRALHWDIVVDDALIDVKVIDAAVVLSGTVGSAAEKNRLVKISHMANVKSVDATGVKITFKASDKILRKDKYIGLADVEIRKAVQDAMFYDPRISSFTILAEVDNGVVTLRGTVDNLQAKIAASRTARNTVGVVQVVNRLRVRPLMIYYDADIKTNILENFQRDPFIQIKEITIAVRNGIVELAGSVNSSFEKSHAEELAMRVNGVVGVNNHLVINAIPPEPLPYDPFLDDWYVRR